MNDEGEDQTRDETDDEAEGLLGRLPAPPLDERFAARVLALAKAHLEPAPAEGLARLRLRLASAVVPGLLATAAVDHVAETAQVVKTVYGPHAARPARGPRRT